MSLTFPVDAKLKDGSPVQLALADEWDVEPLKEGEPLNFFWRELFYG